MADSDQKTEQPTPKRRQEAREKGEIPRSPELTTAVLLFGSAALLGGLGTALARSLGSIFVSALAAIGATTLDAHGAVALLQRTGWKTVAALAPLLLALSGIAVAVGALQARGVASATPMQPKFERINPLSNAKRFFGMQPTMDLLKSLAKLALVGTIVWGGMQAAWTASLALIQSAPFSLVGVVSEHALGMLRKAGLAYLAIAGVDYAWQVWQHEKNLRMSKEEVKQEMKQSEGDPLLKARMRSIGRQLARRQMFKDVPNADVVVTNPTHIAVALKYDPERHSAPVVLAMGQRKVAERIKQIAREAGVPTVENKPLARALLASARVGDLIPAELFLAVAEVLAFVIRSRATRGRWAGSAQA